MDNLTAIPYLQARDLIEDGDLVFVAHRNKLTARAVQFFTKSKFSHVCIAFWVNVDGVKRLLAVQAQGGNKRFIMNLSAIQNKAQLYVVTAPRAWIEVAPAALAQLGVVKYGWMQAIYVGLREFLMTRFNITIKEKQFTGEICSEFAARVYQLADSLVSPQLLYTELMKTQQLRFVVQPQ